MSKSSVEQIHAYFGAIVIDAKFGSVSLNCGNTANVEYVLGEIEGACKAIREELKNV